MYDQKRREVNKAFDKYEKQLKAAKASGKNARVNADKVRVRTAGHATYRIPACLPACL